MPALIRTPLAVLLLLLCAVASAQPDRDRANSLFLEGRDLLAHHDTKAACDKFEASLAIDPTAPGVMLNLGLCYELLEKYASSLYWFRKAQSAAAEARLPAYEDEAKRHTVSLADKVSTLTLDVSSAPSNVEVRIDDRVVDPTDYARVEIDRGHHRLEARAPGKERWSRTFDVRARDAGTLVIPSLTDVATTPPPSGPGNPEQPAPTGASPTGRYILAASFGAAGLGLCIASPIWASRIKSTYDRQVAAGENPSASDARNKEHIATGMFVAGAALIAVGTYVYLTTPSGTTVAPLVTPTTAGLTLSTRF